MRRITSFALALFMTLYIFISPEKVSSDAVSDMNSLVNSYWRTCAVMIYSEETGQQLYSYNKDRQIFCASVIKLPYAVYVCHQISAGVRSLDDTIVYTSGWYHGGSGVIKNGGYGRTYTVRQLLDYMLRYSDNVAYDMLVYLFGTYGFNQMVSGWGYNVALGTPSPRWPNITAAFMQKSMHEMYIHRNDGDSWRTAWKALNESTDVLVRGVLGESGKTPVAIKYGLVEYVYHEVCFIDGESPYILVILSGASGYQCDAGFVKKVAECAGRIVSEKLPVRRELGSYTAASRITGDIDLDNKADVKDLIILKKILFSEQKMNSLSRHSADINRDGQINILDMNALKRIMINTK